jgi:hypothetical protein
MRGDRVKMRQPPAVRPLCELKKLVIGRMGTCAAVAAGEEPAAYSRALGILGMGRTVVQLVSWAWGGSCLSGDRPFYLGAGDLRTAVLVL